MLTRYKLYVGSNRYKLKSPSFVGKGSFVKGLAVSLSEVVSAHVNVTCFDGGDGSVTVVASGGTPPYQYSIDPTFATYNTDGLFSNLSLVGPVDEGTDQYGGILISHRRFYVRDASGQIVSCVVDLVSPVALEWLYDENFYTLVSESDSSINLSCVLYADEQGTEYVPNVDFNAPYVSTTKNVRTLAPTGYPSNYIFYPNQTYNVQYSARNTTCDELQYCRIAITVLPNE